MPSSDYTSPGNYSWTAPFACRNVTATCIGGGGSGFKDKTDNEAGGGGGGGGFGKSTRSVPGGATLSIRVGEGGAQPGNQNANNGQDSYVVSSYISVYGYGGDRGRDGVGGSGSGGAGDVTGKGETGQDDANDGSEGGRGGGAGKPGGNAGGCGGRPLGGQGVTLDGTNGSCTGGRAGGNYGGGGGGNSNGGEAGRGGKGAVRLEWDFHPPQINDFTAGTQYSTGGTPRDDVFISWSTTYATSVSISGIGGVAVNGSGTYNTGVQSVAGGNSPATRSYTITASGPGGTVTATATAYVKNDNTPSNSWTTTFTNLEPSTEYAKLLGTLSGVDMPTRISSPNSGVFFANGANGSYANPQIFTNGQDVYIKMITLPFNTDVSGVTGDFGKTNTKTVSVTAGGLSAFNVSYVTRKPRISEDFNYDGQVGYPFEDIDLITNTPTSTLVTQTLNMDDIEIDMEIKADDPDIEIKINNGSWQSIREI